MLCYAVAFIQSASLIQSYIYTGNRINTLTSQQIIPFTHTLLGDGLSSRDATVRGQNTIWKLFLWSNAASKSSVAWYIEEGLARALLFAHIIRYISHFIYMEWIYIGMEWILFASRAHRKIYQKTDPEPTDVLFQKYVVCVVCVWFHPTLATWRCYCTDIKLLHTIYILYKESEFIVWVYGLEAKRYVCRVLMLLLLLCCFLYECFWA